MTEFMTVVYWSALTDIINECCGSAHNDKSNESCVLAHIALTNGNNECNMYQLIMTQLIYFKHI